MGLGIAYQRLAHQRKVEHKKSNEIEVIDKYLGQYVVMPQDVDLSFIQWWIKLDNTEVSVCFPHECHGQSTKWKKCADSSSATHYFLPKFRIVQTPKIGVLNYEQQYSQSVVGEFNGS